MTPHHRPTPRRRARRAGRHRDPLRPAADPLRAQRPRSRCRSRLRPSPMGCQSPPEISATSSTATWLTPTTTGRLACDASVHRLVLDPAGIPLDLGRSVRVFTPAQRRAAGRARLRLPVPRLRPTSPAHRRPPPHPLGREAAHRPRQRAAPLPPPPPAGPRGRLDHRLCSPDAWRPRHPHLPRPHRPTTHIGSATLPRGAGPLIGHQMRPFLRPSVDAHALARNV